LPSLSSELQILKEFGNNSTDELNPSGKPKRKRKKNKHHNHRGRNGHRRGHLRSSHHHKRQRTRPTDILRAEDDPKAEGLVKKNEIDKTSKLETASTETLRSGRRNKRPRSRGSRHLGFNDHHHSHHYHRSQHEFNQNDERPQHHHRQHRRLRLHHRRNKHHNSQNASVDPAAKLNTLDKIEESSIRRILNR